MHQAELLQVSDLDSCSKAHTLCTCSQSLRYGLIMHFARQCWQLFNKADSAELLDQVDGKSQI